MWGLTINMSKTDYLKVGEDTVSDLQMDTNIVKGCRSFNNSIVKQ